MTFRLAWADFESYAGGCQSVKATQPNKRKRDLSFP